MLRDVKVRDHMTTPLIAVEPTTLIRVAQQLIEDQHIRHLSVVEGNHLVGIVSSGDIRRAMPSSATSLSVWELYYLWGKVTVEASMSPNPITVKPDTPLLEAVRRMYEHRFNSLPVVDDDERLAGILTEVDIDRLLLQTTEQDVSTPETRHGGCLMVAL